MNYLTGETDTVSLRIKQIREQSNLTQEKLADILGVSVNYLGEVERGRRPLSLALATRFCSYFHISFDYLYRGVPSAEWNILETSSSWYGVREHTTYRSIKESLISQLDTCSEEELQIISRLVFTYLYTSRQQLFLSSRKEEGAPEEK